MIFLKAICDICSDYMKVVNGFYFDKMKKKIEDIHCKIVADHANMPVSFYVRFFFVFDDLLICRHHIINSEWCVVLASGHSCQFVLLKNA